MVNNRRILIVEVNWVGDVLFSTAAIRALKNKFPDSFIACLLHKRCKDILTGNPNINEIIILDEEEKHKGLLGKLRLISQLKEKRFDTVYLFHRSFTRTLVCFLSGIKNRIGYYTAKRKILLTESVPIPKEVIHRAAYFYYLVTREVTFDKDILYCDFFVNNADLFYIDAILEKECANPVRDRTPTASDGCPVRSKASKRDGCLRQPVSNGVNKNKKIVVMHPAANWLPKRWPKENFAQLADKLIEEFDVCVIFSGAQKESSLIAGILSLMKNKAVNLCGRTSLKQLGALLKRADLVVSADSGPLHIAVALNRPTAALFGPTSKDITGPLTKENIILLQKEVNCVIPCYQENCLDNRCMKQISAQEVINCIQEKQWLA